MLPKFNCLLHLGVAAVTSTAASAQLTLLDHLRFGAACGCAVDSTTEEVFVIRCSELSIQVVSSEGERLRSLPLPSFTVENVDLDVVTTPFWLAGTLVPAGSVLYIIGDYLTADIYALDPAEGTVIATLDTAFGDGKVVGGAYHPGRGSLFLVQSRLASTSADTVAEIDCATGAVLNLFDLIGQGFTVNHGDIDVSAANGNLFIVSSFEDAVAEYTADGSFVQEHVLPFAATGPTGIALIDGTGEALVTPYLGLAARLSGFPVPPCDCEMTGDFPAAVDVFDLLAYLDLWFSVDAAAERTGDLPANIDVFDLLDYLDCWFAGC